MNQSKAATEALEALKDPLKALDYLGIDSMKQLVLSQNGNPPLIRLLDARELLYYFAEGGGIRRRQYMERLHPEVFCSQEFVEKLLADFAIDLEQKDRGLSREHPVREQFYQFPGIVALSYARIGADADLPDPDGPDPEGEQVKMLLPVLEWYMSERANLIMRVGKQNGKGRIVVKPQDAPCDPSFGMFIDFMSMHQPPFETGEQEAFGAALSNIGLLYGHRRTALWKIVDTPTADWLRQYSQRGWCLLEKALADLLSMQHLSLDVSKFHKRESHNFFRGCTSSSAFGSAAGARKSTEELAAQADQKSVYSFGKTLPFPTLSVMTREAGGPPVDEEVFAEMAKKLQFSQARDLEVCCGIYARAARQVLREHITELDYEELQWDALDWEHLGLTLRRCERLQSLTIKNMQLQGHAEAVFGALEKGALPALVKLDLNENEQFGEAGCVALAGAAQRGALPALKELELYRCEVTGALFEALNARALPALSKVDLTWNATFGDAGCVALAGAVERGAMPALAEVALCDCGVTREGLRALRLPEDTDLGHGEGVTWVSLAGLRQALAWEWVGRQLEPVHSGLFGSSSQTRRADADADAATGNQERDQLGKGGAVEEEETLLGRLHAAVFGSAEPEVRPSVPRGGRVRV